MTDRRAFLTSVGCAGFLAACGGSTAEKQSVPEQKWNDPITPDNYIDRRVANHVGGTPGWVCANRWTVTEVGADVTNFEWNSVGILHNRANRGENCAGYFQGNAYSTGSTWANVSEVSDRSMGKNPNVVAHEFDVWAPGHAGRDNRIGCHIVMGKPPPEYRNGHTVFGGDEAIRISASPTREGSYWRKGMTMEGITETLIDASQAVPERVMDLHPSTVVAMAPGSYAGKVPVRVGQLTFYIPVYN